MSTPTGFHPNPDPVSGISNGERLLTAEQLAARWQVPKAHVHRLARDGRVPVVMIGRYHRFRQASIEQWEATQEAASDG